MGTDYAALSFWKTDDLLYRDRVLQARTRVLGVSQGAAVIHIVALVCTSGASLPINLAFCIWHGRRYKRAKKERLWIRQILGTRNLSYKGRGQWVNVTPVPIPAPNHFTHFEMGRGQWVNGTPAPNHFTHFEMGGGQWVNGTPAPVPAPNHFGHFEMGRGQWVNGTPAPNPTPNQFAHFDTSRDQWVNGTPAPNNDVTDPYSQFAQAAWSAAGNEAQQNFADSDPNSQSYVPDDQSYLDC